MIKIVQFTCLPTQLESVEPVCTNLKIIIKYLGNHPLIWLFEMVPILEFLRVMEDMLRKLLKRMMRLEEPTSLSMSMFSPTAFAGSRAEKESRCPERSPRICKS